MMHNILIGLLLIISITLVVSVLLQPSKTDGFSSLMSGKTETFFAKNKGRTKEAFLAKITMVSAIIFAAVVLALGIIT